MVCACDTAPRARQVGEKWAGGVTRFGKEIDEVRAPKPCQGCVMSCQTLVPGP